MRFFRFPDGVEELAKNGAVAVIQPGGSVRDHEVIEAADRLGLAMVFTGIGISGTDGTRRPWETPRRFAPR